MREMIRTETMVAMSVLAFVLVAGCDGTPQAPELVNSSVYQNESEGFRFRVPEGWTQTASSILPAGDFPGENFLVRYLVQSPEGGATLQVLCFVEAERTDLERHHEQGSFGVPAWTASSPAESVDLGGADAIRMAYQGTLGGKLMRKQIQCVRRGNRVYSFVGMFVDGDDKAQHAIDRALDSLIWEH